jgi:penicillin-binding protein 1A
VTVANATALSINCAYIRMAAVVGLDKVAAMAKRLGVGLDPGHPLDEVPSMVIGSEEATPLEMAGAYATLANDGVRHSPTFIDKVLDRNGKEILKVDDEGKRLLSPEISRVAVQVLKGVVTNGTGTRAQLVRHVSAGKTGTTDDFTNAWFIGFTPQLTTAVWMGSPSGNVPMTNVGGIRVFGGTYPAKIWHDYMTGALDGLPSVDFPAPNPMLVPGGADLRVAGEVRSTVPPRPVPRTTPVVTAPQPTVNLAPPTLVPPLSIPHTTLFPPLTLPPKHTLPSFPTRTSRVRTPRPPSPP